MSPWSADLLDPDILVPPSPRERRHHDHLSVDVLDHLLRRLGRQEALCRGVLGRLALPFLLRRAHLKLGFVRIDDYARERLGVSGRELQELARVTRKLEELPRVAQAFAAGRVSWSHLRLLATVVTPDTESVWLARARRETVRGLESAVASARGAPPDPNEDAVQGEPRVRFHIRCPRRVRRLWRDATEFASRMSGGSLAAWRTAEAIAAEGLASGAADTPPAADRQAPPVPESPSPVAIVWEAVDEAVPDDVQKLAFRADSLDPFQLDERLRAAMAALQRIDFQTGRLLRFVADERLYRTFGFGLFIDYVRDRLAFSPRKARALIALDRRLHRFPALAEAYRAGRISFARAFTIVPVLHPDTEAAWVHRASKVTLRLLGELVDWALEVGGPDHPLPPPEDTRPVFPPLDEVQMCARDLDAEIAFHGPASVVALFRVAVHAFTPRGAPPWHGLERLLLHALAEWQRQPRHRDPIFERDGWRCAVPACTARSSLHDHHIVYRSEGGDHSPDNRVAICAAHHLHGIHGMRIKVSGVAPHDLTWEIGLRTPRPPLIRTHGDRYLDVDA